MGDVKITKEDVRYVAQLARLNLSPEEMETFTLQINRILSYMEKLNELDTTTVEPLSHAIDVANAFRDDVVGESLIRGAVLKNAPETEKGFFKVPRIIED
jgi:aspartyl-tRNA(Asn)/glutamyl-tRNA(Gln) amidotransferase subunit C